MKTAHAKVEPEQSFSVAPGDVEEVLSLIYPKRGSINIDGHLASVVSFNIKRVAHLFTENTRGNDKERLRISRTDGTTVCSVDVKTYADGLKLEKTVKKMEGAKAVAKTLRKHSRIVCAFAKERFSVSYEFNALPTKKRRFTLSVDRIVPISLASERQSASLYQLECEGDGKGGETHWVQSPEFRKFLLPLLKPLTYSDSKWLKARAAFPGPFDVGHWRARDVKRLMLRIDGIFSPPGARLLVDPPYS